MTRQQPRNQPFDPARGGPRGRPPAAVVVALGAVALTLHGCLLDGLPGDAADGSPQAVAVAAALQVRSVSELADRAAVDAVEARVEPVVRLAEAAMPVARSAATLASTQPEPNPQAATPAAEAAGQMGSAAAVEPTDPPAIAAEPASVPVAATAEAPPAASATEAAASLAPAAAPVLRQVERSVPIYKTRLPPAAVLVYDIRRGMFAGMGELNWQPQAGHYEARLQVSIAGFNVLTQVSQGAFDAAGLAPVRFTDQRARRAARAANFQRDAHKISYSDSSDEYALPGGSQDRLSWMIQLPAVLAAEPRRASPGGEVQMVVSGVRADVAVWSFAFVGAETIDSGGAKVRTLRFTRTPQGPRDVLADVWLDPAHHLFPVRAVLSHGDDSDALELSLRQIKVAGKP
jgi:hypothetical protein